MDRQSRIIRYMLLSLLLLASSVVATATAERVVVTSGRVVYDAFGRAVATYHPTVATVSVYDFSAAIDTVPPTVTEYDVLDRPTRVIYPDDNIVTSNIAYIYKTMGDKKNALKYYRLLSNCGDEEMEELARQAISELTE